MATRVYMRTVKVELSNEGQEFLVVVERWQESLELLDLHTMRDEKMTGAA